MPPDFEDYCEALDAAIFTGDSLLWKENRDMLADYIGRWQRESLRMARHSGPPEETSPNSVDAARRGP